MKFHWLNAYLRTSLLNCREYISTRLVESAANSFYRLPTIFFPRVFFEPVSINDGESQLIKQNKSKFRCRKKCPFPHLQTFSIRILRFLRIFGNNILIRINKRDLLIKLVFSHLSLRRGSALQNFTHGCLLRTFLNDISKNNYSPRQKRFPDPRPSS